MTTILKLLAATFRLCFDVSGTMRRRDYLLFLPLSIAGFIVVFSAWNLLADTPAWVIFLYTAALFYLPVTAAGARRLRDAGHSGWDMLDPLKPALVLLTLWLVLGVLWPDAGYLLLVISVGMTLLAPPFLIAWGLLAVIAVGATLVLFSQTFAKLLEPTGTGSKGSPRRNKRSARARRRSSVRYRSARTVLLENAFVPRLSLEYAR